MLQALRIRDFRLLWAGSLISSLGSWLLVIAIPAHVLQVTGSLRDTGLTLAAEYLPPLVLGPAAGVAIDRWDRRRLMIATSLFRAGAVAAMLAGIAPGRYWILYAALVAESGGGVLYSPTEQARTPAIVGTGPLLSSANSLNAFADGAVRFVGGPLGGILLAFCGVRWLICADVLSYLVCAAASFMTSRTDGENTRRHHRVISDLARDLLEGVRVLRGQPVTRALLPVTVIFLAANASLSAVLMPFGIQKLGGSEHTGFLLACLGVGFLLGAPVLRPLLDRLQPRILLTASLTATAVMYYLLFTSSSLATALPAATAIGLSGSMSQVIALTAMQRVIPGAALGRVSAAFLTGEAAATLTGAVTGPFLAQTVHLAGAAIASAAVTLGAAVLTCLTMPELSHYAGLSRQSDVTLNDDEEITMDARLNYYSSNVAAKFAKYINSAGAVITDSALPTATQDLVKIRASQINGCAVCTDMHTKDAEHAGETSVRLNLVAVWRDAKVFTDAERAALELTEQGTRLADAAVGVTDEAWANAAKHYDDDQLAALVSLIALINAYNRMNAITRQPGGYYQPGQWR